MLIYVLRWRPSWISDRHKNRNLVKDIPMIIHLQFGFSHFISFRDEAATSAISKKTINEEEDEKI